MAFKVALPSLPLALVSLLPARPAQVAVHPCSPTGQGSTSYVPACRWHASIHKSLTHYCPQTHPVTMIALDSTNDCSLPDPHHCHLFPGSLDSRPAPQAPDPAPEVSRPIILNSCHCLFPSSIQPMGAGPRVPQALTLALEPQLLRCLQKGGAGPVGSSVVSQSPAGSRSMVAPFFSPFSFPPTQ